LPAAADVVTNASTPKALIATVVDLRNGLMTMPFACGPQTSTM
jgi:hypothetical protein